MGGTNNDSKSRRLGGDPRDRVRFYQVTVPTDRHCNFKSISRASLLTRTTVTNLPHSYPSDTWISKFVMSVRLRLLLPSHLLNNRCALLVLSAVLRDLLTGRLGISGLWSLVYTKWGTGLRTWYCRQDEFRICLKIQGHEIAEAFDTAGESDWPEKELPRSYPKWAQNLEYTPTEYRGWRSDNRFY